MNQTHVEWTPLTYFNTEKDAAKCLEIYAAREHKSIQAISRGDEKVAKWICTDAKCDWYVSLHRKTASFDEENHANSSNIPAGSLYVASMNLQHKESCASTSKDSKERGETRCNLNTSSLPPRFKQDVSLESIRITAERFANVRDWNQFHTPRNLALAMVGEVGELCEIFQWRGEAEGNNIQGSLPPIEMYNTSMCKNLVHDGDWTVSIAWKEEDRIHLGEELSDVLIYLVRLADQCGVDLGQAVQDKFCKNEAKYPVDLVRGSSKKYTAYEASAEVSRAAKKPRTETETTFSQEELKKTLASD